MLESIYLSNTESSDENNQDISELLAPLGTRARFHEKVTLGKKKMFLNNIEAVKPWPIET